MRTRLGGRGINTWREKPNGSILAASKFSDVINAVELSLKNKDKSYYSC